MRTLIKNYHPKMLWELGALPFSAAAMYLKKPKFRVSKIAFGEHARQYLLFCLPPEPLERKKTWLMFYHGGGWQLGKPGMFPQLADFFLGMGYPVILPAYRLSPRFSFTDMREDLDLAVLKMLELMHDTSGGDDDTVIVGGMSAGANLAAHLLFDAAALKNIRVSPSLFSGFLSCGGPLDLSYLPDTFPLRQFTGGAHLSPAFQRANPINLLSAQSPALPALFIHGTADLIVPYRSGVSFYEAYKNTGDAELVTLSQKTHLQAIRWIYDDEATAARVKAWLGRID